MWREGSIQTPIRRMCLLPHLGAIGHEEAITLYLFLYPHGCQKPEPSTHQTIVYLFTASTAYGAISVTDSVFCRMTTARVSGSQHATSSGIKKKNAYLCRNRACLILSTNVCRISVKEFWWGWNNWHGTDHRSATPNEKSHWQKQRRGPKSHR